MDGGAEEVEDNRTYVFLYARIGIDSAKAYCSLKLGFPFCSFLQFSCSVIVLEVHLLILNVVRGTVEATILHCIDRLWSLIK